MARTAVVVGTASAVAGHSAQKNAAQAQAASNAQQLEDMQRQAEIDAAVQQAVAAAPVAAAPVAAAPIAAAPIAAASFAPPAATSIVDQLKELASLKDAGVLSEAEFAAAKAQLLG
jgi:Short C-terminal domain